MFNSLPNYIKHIPHSPIDEGMQIPHWYLFAQIAAIRAASISWIDASLRITRAMILVCANFR